LAQKIRRLLLLILPFLVAYSLYLPDEFENDKLVANDQPVLSTIKNIYSDQTKRNTLEISWKDLIPPDQKVKIEVEKNDIGLIEHDDPRIKILAQQRLTNASVNQLLDGERVKIPGFIVPLEMDTKAISEFLLVPYYGACIHVPPPPANQIIYVKSPLDRPYTGEQFDTVWVTGIMRVEQYSSGIGDAGYAIQATAIQPYERETRYINSLIAIIILILIGLYSIKPIGKK